MANLTFPKGSYTALGITALSGLANSATVGWKSALVDLTAIKPSDVEISCSFDMANTAPANDKAVYVYIAPAMRLADDTTFRYNDGGNATLPTAGDAGYTITSPNDLVLLGIMSYTTADMMMNKLFQLSNVFNTMPDGFLIIVINFSGATLTTALVGYKTVTANME